jgi:hypothetical protein
MSLLFQLSVITPFSFERVVLFLESREQGVKPVQYLLYKSKKTVTARSERTVDF